MFIFYWGMLSSITPPVAIASFAAGIAGSAMKTWMGSMWSAASHFIPFFVLNPALVLVEIVPILSGSAYWPLPPSAPCSRHSGLSALWGPRAGPACLNGRCALLVIGGFVVATPAAASCRSAIADHVSRAANLAPTVLIALP
jgi:TRAP-type uncharacterized transport system fused permease subunit